MIAILDYGSGNLRSAQRAFERSGKEVVVTSNREIALNAQGLVVPGVGAFAACMRGLVAVGGDAIVRERLAMQRPTLGICVGMQILFRDGDEHTNGPLHQGVGIWQESITKLDAPILPHMGWNTVEVSSKSIFLLRALICCKKACWNRASLEHSQREVFGGSRRWCDCSNAISS